MRRYNEVVGDKNSEIDTHKLYGASDIE